MGVGLQERIEYFGIELCKAHSITGELMSRTFTFWRLAYSRSRLKLPSQGKKMGWHGSTWYALYILLSSTYSRYFGEHVLFRVRVQAVKHYTGHPSSKPLVGYHSEMRGLLPYVKRASFGYFHMCRCGWVASFGKLCFKGDTVAVSELVSYAQGASFECSPLLSVRKYRTSKVCASDVFRL